MMQFFGLVVKLPVEAFVYSMEMFVKTMRGVQKIAFQGIDMMADRGTQAPVGALSIESEVYEAVPEAIHATYQDDDGSSDAEAITVTTQEEARRMPDKNLNDDMLKLVRYKILFVKRDYEIAFREQEELVSENTNETGYIAWKVAQFIQGLNDEPIPKKWQEKNYPRADKSSDAKIQSLPEDDKKYLRVYFEVLERYPRERFKYEERQIEVLEQIRDNLDKRETTASASPTSPSASSTSPSSSSTSSSPSQQPRSS